METIYLDVRYGWRVLRKSPGFALVIVLMLALGIGGNTAVFTVLSAVLLRPLPFEKPQELVQVWETRTSGAFQQMEASYPDFVDMRNSQVFAQLGGYSRSTMTLSQPSGAVQVTVAMASTGFFETLGVRPVLGRSFVPSEETEQKTASLLLSYGGWQRRFGGDPAVVGKTLSLDGVPSTIVGVLPKDFQFGPTNSADFWQSLQVSGWRLRRNAHWLYPIGRLRSGASLQQAQSVLLSVTQRLESQYPDSNAGVAVRLFPLREELLGSMRLVVIVLMATVGFVLLITCANIAGLLLARSVPRQKEISIRSALGAGRARIVRQLFTESVLLSVAGGVAGVLAAYWAVPAIVAAIPETDLLAMPALEGLRVQGDVLWFSLALSLLTGILFGLAPILETFKIDLRQSLQEAGRSATGSFHHRLRGALVISEVAMAVVLLASAGLMLKSLKRVLDNDPGFNTENLLTLALSLPDKTYSDGPRQLGFQHQLLQRTNSLPGVKAAAAVTIVPLSGAGNTSRFDLVGHPKSGGGEEYEANTRSITTNYFSVMGIPLRAGRFLNATDAEKSTHVIVINQALADAVFPHQDPLGKQINFTYTSDPNVWQIVGVVGNENVGWLDRIPSPVIYDSFDQDPPSYFSLVVRTQQDPAALASAVTHAARQIDSEVPVYAIASMAQIISESPTILLRSYPAYLLGAFAGLALLLAVLGLYALLAYSVAQRTRELGLRMALGAQQKDVLRLILHSGVRLALMGAALGVAGAVAAGQVIARLLFGVTPTDATTFAGVCLVLIISVLLASYVPAYRATKVDPMVALRYE
jgi:putative ABC transport system permease protein